VALYDTVKRKGWSINIRTHGIKYILDYLLNEDWDPASGREVPVIEEERDCLVSFTFHCSSVLSVSADAKDNMQDCSQWEFGRFQNYTR
jgi:hypothetical protein